MINDLSIKIPENLLTQKLRKDIYQYYSFLAAQKRYASNTIISYNYDIVNFFNFFNRFNINHRDIEDISLNFIRDWLAQRLENNCNKSNSRALSAIKSLCRYLKNNNKIINCRVFEIKSPKINIKLPKAIDECDIKKILCEVENINKKIWQVKRDQSLIILIYGCGLRVSEALNLNINSINNDVINIYSKGNKERIIPILPMIKEKLYDYIRLMPYQTLINQALFISNLGKKYHRRSFNQLLINIRRSLNLSETITPHSFRHSFATHLLEEGADLRAIQQLMGHENLVTTEKYIKINKKKLLENYDKFSIR
jgi:integrase/recombinase XerC